MNQNPQTVFSSFHFVAYEKVGEFKNTHLDTINSNLTDERL